MAQLLSALSVLVVIVIGALITAQVVSVEKLGAGVWHGFLLIVLASVAGWFVEAFVLPILICTLVLLRQAMFVFLAVVVAAAALLLCLRFLKSATGMRRASRKTEE